MNRSKRGRPPKKPKDIATEIIDKLNTLALGVLDDLLEKRRSGTTLDIEQVRVPLFAIKEIKDLCKINAKIKDSSFGGFFDDEAKDDSPELDADKILGIDELENKEKEIEGGLYDNRRTKTTASKEKIELA